MSTPGFTAERTLRGSKGTYHDEQHQGPTRGDVVTTAQCPGIVTGRAYGTHHSSHVIARRYAFQLARRNAIRQCSQYPGCTVTEPQQAGNMTENGIPCRRRLHPTGGRIIECFATRTYPCIGGGEEPIPLGDLPDRPFVWKPALITIGVSVLVIGGGWLLGAGGVVLGGTKAVTTVLPPVLAGVGS